MMHSFLKDSFKLITKPKLAPPPSRIGIASILFICGLGGIAAATVGYSARQEYQDSHLQRTNSIAQAIPINELSGLKGIATDKEQPNYKLIKERLKRIKQVNDDIRFVYITTMRDNNIYFMADSEEESSRDYSAPGDQYDEASFRFLQAFQSESPLFEGPYADHWGNWMSSEAPIFDPQTGKMIGMLGIDSPVNRYYYDVGIRIMVPIFIAITASLLLWKIDNVRRKHEEIARLKNQFVSIASHELRSPLSGMLWAIQSLLNDKKITKSQAHTLSDMYKSTESSIATVNEILDLSVFEHHRERSLQKVDMDLNLVAHEVVKNLKLAAAEKNIEIIDKGLSHKAPLYGDPAGIKRAVTNLVSNAIKYSPGGSAIRITYRRHGHWHHLSVADKGIGIPKKDQKKVLSGYYRSKNAIKIQSTGTGLGLYVTKLMVEQHGGKLKLTSVENHGTSITMQLPINDEPKKS